MTDGTGKIGLVEPVCEAVALLSGGLDSATAAAMATREGFRVRALTLRYGQRHEVEVQAAGRVARSLGVVEHVVLDLDLRAFGGSALTDEIEVPKSLSVEGVGGGIPITYVPARNTIFLALALGLAEARGCSDVFIGVSAVDYSGYPDCRPEFIRAFQDLSVVATKAGVTGNAIRIHAPLISMNKAEIIREGVELGVDYSLTHSCYDPTAEGLACGHCDSCLLRLDGFRRAGVIDPIRYQAG